MFWLNYGEEQHSKEQEILSKLSLLCRTTNSEQGQRERKNEQDQRSRQCLTVSPSANPTVLSGWGQTMRAFSCVYGAATQQGICKSPPDINDWANQCASNNIHVVKDSKIRIFFKTLNIVRGEYL